MGCFLAQTSSSEAFKKQMIGNRKAVQISAGAPTADSREKCSGNGEVEKCVCEGACVRETLSGDFVNNSSSLYPDLFFNH